MPEASEGPESCEILTDFRFGAIAVWGRLVSQEAVEEALSHQSAARSSGKTPLRIGEILLERGLVTEEQVRRVLKVQLQRLPAEGHLIFGQIAEAHRFVSPEDNRRALDVQAREILAGGRVRPLADILIDVGAIDREAADAVISYQARGDSTRMSETRKARAEGERGPEPGGGPPSRPVIKRTTAAVDPPAGPKPLRRGEGPTGARPAFLPRGKLGFVVDHSTWLVIAAAALFAIALAVFKERIFGGPDPTPPAERSRTGPRSCGP